MAETKWLVLCDFDGTLAEQDITHLIWDRYIQPNWREELLPPYRAGKVTPLELMAAGYFPISASEKELMDFVRPQVSLRAGFLEFQEQCRAKAWPFYVLSGGLDFYIRPFLPPGTEFFSYTAELRETWHVTLPEHVLLSKDEDFKVHIAGALKAKHKDFKVLYIGDGRNDFLAARISDKVCAIRGSTLARLCAQAQIQHSEFVNFAEIKLDEF